MTSEFSDELKKRFHFSFLKTEFSKIAEKKNRHLIYFIERCARKAEEKNNQEKKRR